ncbi:hypothetical protein DFJ74DRAFT_604912 [Hyaloraphidium curvatum]|nr:hypothetical protein DFJ74DRAFT_604912 [Hyaloraphidium curvatum]
MAGPILTVGILPAKAPPMPSIPGLTPEKIAEQVRQAREELTALGYPTTSFFLELDDGDWTRLKETLAGTDWKAILVGAGVRLPPPNLELFEKVINVVHEYAPKAKIAFNTTPADTAQAAKRVLGI